MSKEKISNENNTPNSLNRGKSAVNIMRQNNLINSYQISMKHLFFLDKEKILKIMKQIWRNWMNTNIINYYFN